MAAYDYLSFMGRGGLMSKFDNLFSVVILIIH